MYIKRYAYYCNFGTDADRCLPRESQPRGDRRDGWRLALERVGNRRVAAASARSTVLASAAALRCTDTIRDGADARAVLAHLPLFVATGTGLGCTAHFVQTMTAAPAHAELARFVFSSGGPHVLETLRYATSMHAGTVAQFAGVTGPNASLTGTDAGLLALHRAKQFMRCSRVSEALVVCAESLLEWSDHNSKEHVEPREFGCAFLLTRVPQPASPRLHLVSVPDVPAQAPRFQHFEATNGPLNLCWALEHEPGMARVFEQPVINGIRWSYGVSYESV